MTIEVKARPNHSLARQTLAGDRNLGKRILVENGKAVSFIHRLDSDRDGIPHTNYYVIGIEGGAVVNGKEVLLKPEEKYPTRQGPIFIGV